MSHGPPRTHGIDIPPPQVTAMLGSLGFGAYAVGQMEVVDDPEGYSRKALMSILLGEGVEVMMICTATFDRFWTVAFPDCPVAPCKKLFKKTCNLPCFMPTLIGC